ncbi:hypothetical protein [Archangium lansingense]|uniref:Outer membrane protein beta-barrel domain-containing protein n=1 Tax=Archangium lansingense TaxID=2995310 RepID=A0ABT4API3_9BACT|nr:hypothetical protein [Archangium lansinium]MCY1082764.1 hypothetical protein [Archangium lansinium]
MKTRSGVSALLLLAGLLAGTQAEAEEKREGHGWDITVEANTDFPLSVGGRLGVESPWRLRLSTSLGYLPPAYMAVVNDVAVKLGAYGRNEADLIESSLKNSLVWRTHVGWRPFPRLGLYVDGGYGLVSLGGEVNTEDVLVTLTGLEPPEGETVLDREYRVRSVLHMLDVEVGWRWGLGAGWTGRTALGAAFTLDSNSRVEPQFEPNQPLLVTAFSRLAEGALDRTFERYVHLPVLSFSIGYAF